MKKNIRKFIGFGVLLFAVLGCSSFMEGFKKSMGESKATQTVTCEDGSCQLTVPDNWSKQTDLNSEATLQVANLLQELYVIIIREDTSGLQKKPTLDAVTKVVRDNMRKTVINPILTEPVSTTIGGFPAKQFEIEGTVSGIKAKYLYAVVETPKNYYQIMSWTLADRYGENKTKLQDAINSFKEISSDVSTTSTNTKKK